jgi:hypothetical protein
MGRSQSHGGVTPLAGLATRPMAGGPVAFVAARKRRGDVTG